MINKKVDPDLPGLSAKSSTQKPKGLKISPLYRTGVYDV